MATGQERSGSDSRLVLQAYAEYEDAQRGRFVREQDVPDAATWQHPGINGDTSVAKQS